MGYGYMEEFDNIMPLIMREYGRKRARDEEIKKDYESQLAGK